MRRSKDGITLNKDYQAIGLAVADALSLSRFEEWRVTAGDVTIIAVEINNSLARRGIKLTGNETPRKPPSAGVR